MRFMDFFRMNADRLEQRFDDVNAEDLKLKGSNYILPPQRSQLDYIYKKNIFDLYPNMSREKFLKTKSWLKHIWDQQCHRRGCLHSLFSPLSRKSVDMDPHCKICWNQGSQNKILRTKGRKYKEKGTGRCVKGTEEKRGERWCEKGAGREGQQVKQIIHVSYV